MEIDKQCKSNKCINGLCAAETKAIESTEGEVGQPCLIEGRQCKKPNTICHKNANGTLTCLGLKDYYKCNSNEDCVSTRCTSDRCEQ